MSAGNRVRRLVGFLGLGKKNGEPPYYDPVHYRFNGKTSTLTPLVQAAIDELLGPFDETVLFGTEEVEDRWFGNGRLASRYLRFPVTFRCVPFGKNEEELRSIFGGLCQELGMDDPGRYEEIVLDVTHGFRIQPILMTSALGFVLSEWERRFGDDKDRPRIRVLYGAHEARTKGDMQVQVAPIWDLTEIVTVERWNAALDALMRYGRADALLGLCRAESKAASESAPESASKAQSKRTWHLGKLGKKARTYADDLAFGRVKNLVTASAPDLERTLTDDATDAWSDRVPVLRGTVKALEEQVERLSADVFSGKPSLEALLALAEHYHRIERYMEEAALLRETLLLILGETLDPPVSPGVPGPEWDPSAYTLLEKVVSTLGGQTIPSRQAASTRESSQSVRVDRFVNAIRERAETDPALSRVVELCAKLPDLRNDLLHLGLRQNPMKPEKIKDGLEGAREVLATWLSLSQCKCSKDAKTAD